MYKLCSFLFHKIKNYLYVNNPRINYIDIEFYEDIKFYKKDMEVENNV